MSPRPPPHSTDLSTTVCMSSTDLVDPSMVTCCFFHTRISHVPSFAHIHTHTLTLTHSLVGAPLLQPVHFAVRSILPAVRQYAAAVSRPPPFVDDVGWEPIKTSPAARTHTVHCRIFSRRLPLQPPSETRIWSVNDRITGTSHGKHHHTEGERVTVDTGFVSTMRLFGLTVYNRALYPGCMAMCLHTCADVCSSNVAGEEHTAHIKPFHAAAIYDEGVGDVTALALDVASCVAEPLQCAVLHTRLHLASPLPAPTLNLIRYGVGQLRDLSASV